MAPPAIHVHLLPALIPPGALQGGVAVVIDILRFTTTMTRALDAGALKVVVCVEVEEAMRRRREIGEGALLGGERGGVRIGGFDLGNSPAEYTRQRVGRKPLVFTTTNGTRAAHASRDAARVLAGCFGNLSALTGVLVDAGTPVHLVCAGTDGEVSLEDSLFAGAVASRLMARGLSPGNDEARLAGLGWAALPPMPGALAEAMHGGHGGQNLARVGLGADVEECALIDTSGVVPEMDAGRGAFTTHAGAAHAVSGGQQVGGPATRGRDQ